MLDKIEYSDIYKFKASLGILLIIASILMPIFVINIDLTRYYEIYELSEVNQSSIFTQEYLINRMVKYWWCISIILLITGIILLIYGLHKWNERQVVLDRIQDIDLETKEKLIEEAPEDEIERKVEEDADEIDIENFNREIFIKDYKNIENSVVKSISNNIINNYDLNRVKIQHNAKIGEFVYDLIMIKRIDNIKREHLIFEIKYYQKNIYYSFLSQGYKSFLYSINNYKNYFRKDNKKIKYSPYMIWVYSSIDQQSKLQKYKEKLISVSRDSNEKIDIIICRDSNIDNLSRMIGK